MIPTLKDLCNCYQGTRKMTMPIRVVCDYNEDIKLEVEYADEGDGVLVLHAIEVFDED